MKFEQCCYFFVASDSLSIIVRTKTGIELGYNQIPSSGSDEVLVRNPSMNRRPIRCGGRKCVVPNLQPGSTYTAWLVSCTGWRPVQCNARAKPLDVTTLPDGKYFFCNG